MGKGKADGKGKGKTDGNGKGKADGKGKGKDDGHQIEQHSEKHEKQHRGNDYDFKGDKPEASAHGTSSHHEEERNDSHDEQYGEKNTDSKHYISDEFSGDNQ